MFARATEIDLALALLPGMTGPRYHSLLHQFGSSSQVFQQNESQLNAFGLKSALVNNIRKGPDFAYVQLQNEAAQKLGANLLLYGNPGYPISLLSLVDAPALLWAKGNLDCLSNAAVAMVGTRKPDDYGKEAAKAFAKQASIEKYTVVSGLARGIDAICHEEALLQQSHTIAVLPTPLADIYPRGHLGLARQIVEGGGLLLSELPFGFQVQAFTFARRNRIISGLSQAVLVIQAPKQSGALITAQYAQKQGKSLYVVPGDAKRLASVGSNTLLARGAHPAIHPREWLLHLYTSKQKERTITGVKPKTNRTATRPTTRPAIREISPSQKPIQWLRSFSPSLDEHLASNLAQHLCSKGLATETLAQAFQCEVHRLSPWLLRQEVMGTIRQNVNGNFIFVS